MTDFSFQGARPGVLHQYARRLVAFEHGGSSGPAKHTVLFIGGLGDGLRTVAYPATLAAQLPADWSLAEVVLSSSYTGWGTSSLGRDSDELAACVRYFQAARPHGRIVLLGHSTGCQDVLHFLTGPGRDARPLVAVAGAILQAPVSDRECMRALLPPAVYEQSVAEAQRMEAAGDADEILASRWLAGFPAGAPCSARRWLSLASPHADGEDDYFSADLSDAQLRATFGRLPHSTQLCILYSGADEYAPLSADAKIALVERWIGVVRAAGARVDRARSGVLPGASHNLNADPPVVVQALVDRVVGFLVGLDGGDPMRDPGRDEPGTDDSKP
ncbi:MAG: hypothetical protein M1826_004805 [Phylliscum demangeonii]|nr:MAG: hypothetical protein M1826_004805 [Phylliscum demangeonii]